MNRILSSIAVFMLLASLGCKKETADIQLPEKSTIYNGRVTATCCGIIVVQTYGSNRFGKVSWNNGTTTYDHVFTAANHCQLTDLKEGSTFKFKVIEDTPQTCAVCLGIIAAPDVKYSIEVVEKINN